MMHRLRSVARIQQVIGGIHVKTKYFVIGVITLSIPGSVLFASVEPIPDFQAMREAEYRAWLESRKLRDTADMLRAVYEKAYQPHFRSAEADAEFATVVQAYRHVIDRYTQTEAAAWCRQRLAGAYQYRGDRDMSQKLLKEAATRALNQKQAVTAAFALGLHHLQSRHDPASALPYFETIPLPPPIPAGAKLDPHLDIRQKYFSAQLQMIKCELALKQVGKARARYDRLARQFDDGKSVYHSLKGLLREAEMTETQFLATEPTKIEPAAPFIPIKAEKSGKWTEDRAPIREFLAQMHRNSGDRMGPNEVKQHVLAFAGDRNALVGPIVRDFWDADSKHPYHWRAVWALAAINTDLSQQQMMKLALTETQVMDVRPYSRNAAQRLIDQLADKARTEPLLWATDQVIACQGAMALTGVELSDKMIHRIIELIGFQHDLPFTITQLCRVLYQDPSTRLIDRKIAVTVESIARIRSHPKAEQIAWPGNVTMAESALWTLIQSLAEMKDARRVLAEHSVEFGNDRSTDTFRVSVLARALTGDALVHDELVSILRELNAGRAREWAATALGRIGTPDDIPLLELVKRHDPLQCKRGGCTAPIKDQLFYPVREAASHAIDQINQREETEGRK
jgi:hypothetical protein